jgi:hypothetical protein
MKSVSWTFQRIMMKNNLRINQSGLPRQTWTQRMTIYLLRDTMDGNGTQDTAMLIKAASGNL